MPSSIAWLDASSEEQRRMREVLGLFTQSEGREELGLGQIRDSLSDGLFPGTSTLHTRARYLLFIPWIFQEVSARSSDLEQARRAELALIGPLAQVAGSAQGVIGGQARAGLKNPPSQLYWSALGTYGILSDPGLTREQAVALHSSAASAHSATGTHTGFRVWRSGMPAPPDGFPDEVPQGFRLSREEAEWLRERVVSAAPESLFAHILAEVPLDPAALTEESGGVRDAPELWDDPAVLRAPGPARTLVEQARRFSLTIHSAQLLYNRLLAESSLDHGFENHADKPEFYAQLLDRWADATRPQEAWDGWDLDEFFAQVSAIRRSPVNPALEAFVREWVRRIQDRGPHGLCEDPEARLLVCRREKRNKGPMARIGNRRRLATWGGSSGAGRLTYRWTVARTFALDVHAGIGGTSPTAATAVGSAAAPTADASAGLLHHPEEHRV